jgi:hypothetical protein
VISLEEKIAGQIRTYSSKLMKTTFDRHVRDNIFVYQKLLLAKALDFHLAYAPDADVTTKRTKKRLVDRAIWRINQLEPRHNVCSFRLSHRFIDFRPLRTLLSLPSLTILTSRLKTTTTKKSQRSSRYEFYKHVSD